MRDDVVVRRLVPVMNTFFTILIADRNSHVRMFLMREMMADGYRVKLTGDGENVLKIAFTPGAVDLLILDPDLPGIEASSLLDALGERIPALPIVLHINRRYYEEKFFMEKNSLCMTIEKEGDSVDRIKEAVRKLLSTSGSSAVERHGSICRKGPTP